MLVLEARSRRRPAPPNLSRASSLCHSHGHPSFTFIELQFDLASLLQKLADVNEACLPFRTRREEPCHLPHFVEALAVLVEVVGAFANREAHLTIRSCSRLHDDFLAEQVAPRNVPVAARFAQRRAVYRRSVSDVDAHRRPLFSKRRVRALQVVALPVTSARVKFDWESKR